MKMLWVFVGIFLVVSCSTASVSRTRTYSNLDKKCEISKLSFDSNKEGCYCKVTGKNERNDVIIYIPISEGNCR